MKLQHKDSRATTRPPTPWKDGMDGSSHQCVTLQDVVIQGSSTTLLAQDEVTRASVDIIPSPQSRATTLPTHPHPHPAFFTRATSTDGRSIPISPSNTRSSRSIAGTTYDII